MSNKKLVLIDGHALAYRVFYALPIDAFTTKEGEPTNATYGFTRTLMDLMLSDDPPKYLAVSFDVGKTFRDEIFPDYKGTREKMPDELRTQLDRIQEVVAAFNIPIMTLEGYEADDVLGTIARQAGPQGVQTHIITGDRDLLQLVNDHTKIELPPGRFQRTPRVYDAARVIEEYSLTPSQIVDWKALEGDKSDNIPGVRGVGKKTSVALLGQYGTLDNIYDHIDEIAPRWRKKLIEGKESAYLSYKLATIVTDAPITLDLAACEAKEFEVDPILELFHQLEFRSLARRLADFAPAAEGESAKSKAEATQTTIVRTAEQLAALVSVLNAADTIAFDVETTGLDKISAETVGICLATQSPAAYYVPVGHLDSAAQAESGQMNLFAGTPALASGQLPLKTVLDAIRPAMTNPAIAKVAHNAKFDYVILHRAGLTVTPLSFDTMLAEWVLDPSSKHLGLKDLSRHRLGVEMQPINTLIGKGRKQISFAEVSIEDAAPYGAADADMTLRLMQPLKAELEEKGLVDLLKLEMQLVPVLADMEQEGIGIDAAFFERFSAELSHKLTDLMTTIHTTAGQPFNINSTQQLSDVLFKQLHLPTKGLKRTKSGHFSTAGSVLQTLQEDDKSGLISHILTFRQLRKIQSTYVDALPNMVNPRTGRIHTNFRQTGAVTGRLASNKPNLQNIPIRSQVGREVRRGFVPKPGHHFMAADYSQVELRILAHVSGDEALTQAFLDDQDVHAATAAGVFNVELEAVTYEQRSFAKAINFGLMYGMGAFRLARETEFTLAEAENFIKRYFEQFPGVRAYLDQTKLKARQDAFVETLLGRRRYFPIFKLRGRANRQFEARAEREAINYPIQGSAADIIKLAMITLHAKLRSGGYKARILLQVHDELLLELPDDELDAVKILVEQTMSHAYKLTVPLKVEAEIGTNWLALKG